MEKFLLRTEGLCVGYGGKAVVREIALAVRPGEIVALIGPNGAGKSTILKTLIGQLPPLDGQIDLDGKPLSSMDAGEIARTLSIVLTERIDGAWMTAEDVVRSGRYPYTGRLGILSAHDRQVMEEALSLTDTAALRECYFRELSDGQRQRVLLARALCQEPKVLVMDEPTSFLDLRYQMELFSLLRKLVSGREMAVVLSLHEVEFARRVCDTAVCIRGGAVDRMGPPSEILTADYLERLYDLPAGSYAEFFRRDTAQKPDKKHDTARKPDKKHDTPQKRILPAYSFVQNQACEMFPCHTGMEAADFNCLFCYCPLYALGNHCGGNFRYTEKGVKDCSECVFPHIRENYRAVLSRFPELAELAKKSPP